MWPMISPQMITNADLLLSRSRPKSLLELMPDPVQFNGVFTYLDDLPFIEPQLNNTEYLYNRSGFKLPSPLVSQLAGDDTLSLVSLRTLARIIENRFRYKWNRIWDEYIESNPLWNNVDLSGTRNGTGSTLDVTSDSSYYSRSNVESKNKGTTDTTVLSGGHEDTATTADTSTTTRSGSVSEREGGTTTEAKSTSGNSITQIQHEGTIGDVASSAGETSRWGFNSSDAVKTNSETSSDGTIRTFNNSDTTTETPSTNDITATAHGRTNTTSYNDMKDGISSNATGSTTRKYKDEKSETSHTGSDVTSTSGSDTVSKAGTKSGTTNTTETTRTSGYNIRNLSDKTEIIKLMYEDPFFHNFWEVIYRDIDEVLTCPVFV